MMALSHGHLKKIFRPIFFCTTAVLLAGCGNELNTTKQEESSKIETENRLLTVFTWEDYLAPEAMTRFEEETGIEVEYVTFGDSDELEAKLRSEPGRHDIVIVDDVSLSELVELKLLHELDHAKLPLLSNIGAEFLDKTFDPKNGFSVPYLWGTWVIAYRKDKFPDVKKSWSFLWDDRIKGRALMIEESFDPISITLMMLGHDPNSENPEHYEEATEAMVRQIHDLDVSYVSDMEVKERLADGTAWASMCYSGDAARVAEENPEVDFFVPEEGTPLWVDNFAIARDTAKSEISHQFINFMMRPDNAAESANYSWFATPNSAAEPLLEKDLRDDERIMPPTDVRVKCETLTKPSAGRLRLINNAWHATRMAMQAKKDKENG